MTAQIFILYVTPTQEVKKNVAIVPSVQDPGPNEVFVGFGATVSTRRGNEIVNTMEWLIDGIRSRNIIDRGPPDLKGAPIVSAVNIDIRQVSDRRTSPTVAGATVADPDIVVAMGSNVTNLGQINITDNVFEQLRRAVIEWLHKNG